jgi:hypothetical protein
LPGTNVTNLRILSSLTAYLRATHPASSKPLKSVEEAPLSRGELRKTLSTCGSIRSSESLNSPFERYLWKLRSTRGIVLSREGDLLRASSLKISRSRRGVVPSREGGLLRASSLKISRSRRGVSASAAKNFF